MIDMKKLFFVFIVLATLLCAACDNGEDLFVPGLSEKIDKKVVEAFTAGTLSKTYKHVSSEIFMKDDNDKWVDPFKIHPEWVYPDGRGVYISEINFDYINICDGKFWKDNNKSYFDRHDGYLSSAWSTFVEESGRNEKRFAKSYTVYPFDINNWTAFDYDVIPIRITAKEIVLCREYTSRWIGSDGPGQAELREIYYFEVSDKDFVPELDRQVYTNDIERDLDIIDVIAGYYGEDSPIAVYNGKYIHDLGPEYVTVKQLREMYSK